MKTYTNAGESVVLRVYPHDGYDNHITINTNDEDHALSKWTATYEIGDETTSINNWKVSSNKKYYY